MDALGGDHAEGVRRERRADCRRLLRWAPGHCLHHVRRCKVQVRATLISTFYLWLDCNQDNDHSQPVLLAVVTEHVTYILIKKHLGAPVAHSTCNLPARGRSFTRSRRTAANRKYFSITVHHSTVSRIGCARRYVERTGVHPVAGMQANK